MEFDWLDVHFDLKEVTPKEIEESFEDPFAIKLLPEGYGDGEEARYFALGKTVGNRPLLNLFWTDGKNYRVIASREMSENERAFYERKYAEAL